MEKETKEILEKEEKTCKKDCTSCDKNNTKCDDKSTECNEDIKKCDGKKCKNKESKEKFNPKEEKKKLLAEMENFRKRFEEEKTHFIKYRSSSFLLEILPTLDMFEMALKAKVADEVKTWLTGFEMVYNNLYTALETEGVSKIKTKVGDELDPNIHNAMEEVESDLIEPGKITEVVLTGYKIHDRLLRATGVKVAKKKIEEENKEKESKGE